MDSIITAVGTPKVKKGDNVKKGDILISGFVKMTDDNNEVVGRTAVPASGSVIVAAEVPFEKKIPKSYQKKVTAGSTKTIYDIELFGLAFSLKNPLKHLDKSYKYDIITTVCVDEPFEGFDFPVTVYKKECTPYERITAEYTKEEALKECEKAFDRYLSELKNSNCEIIDYSGIFDKTADGYLLTGKTKGLFTQTEQKKIEKQKMKKKKRREDTKDGENH